MHGRLPWMEPDELNDAQRRVYDAVTEGARGSAARVFPLADEHGRLHGPFNAMLCGPEIGAALAALGEAIRFRGRLGAREREIAILTVAAGRSSEFEAYAHERVGRLAGLDDGELAALRAGATPPSFDERERAVASTARALLYERDLCDAAYAAAEAQLGAAALTELVTLVGYYDLLALSLRVFRTPLPDDAR